MIKRIFFHRLSFKKFVKNRFAHLLFILIGLILIFPFADDKFSSFPIPSFIFLITILLTLRTLPLNKKILFFSSLIALFAFILEILLALEFFSSIRIYLLFLSTLVYIGFLALAIVVLTIRLTSIKRVTIDTILGGICIYLLIGILWALFYGAIFLVNPKAFYLANPDQNTGFLFYFSFVTLTTLGYGDIYPLDKFATSLAIMEALIGQMFLTIFLARLIGLYIIHELKRIRGI